MTHILIITDIHGTRSEPYTSIKKALRAMKILIEGGAKVVLVEAS
jgi:hypothetical protein